jgi:hypothetical protein
MIYSRNIDFSTDCYQVETTNNSVTGPLNVEREFRIERPKLNYTPIVRNIAIVAAIVGLVVASYFFLPLAAAISLTVVGVLGLSFGGIVNLTKLMLVPSASLFFKNAQKNKAYKINTSLTLKDGTTLTGAMYQDPNKDLLLKDRKLVVAFNANGVLASRESLNLISGKNLFPKENFDVIQMNYRGSGSSKGNFSSHEQHVSDHIEIVDALIKKGYEYKNMVFFGHSLGGSIATCVKEECDKKFADENKSADIIAYQTFQKLDEFVSGHIKVPLVKEFVNGITKLSLKAIGWDVNFDSKRWEKLKGHKIAYGGGNTDTVIPPFMDLAAHLRSQKLPKENYSIRECQHMTIAMDNSWFTSFRRRETREMLTSSKIKKHEELIRKIENL